MQMKRFDGKAEFFRALSDPVRLRIIDFLLNRESCTCTCHLIGHIKRDQSVIFRHLKALEAAKIVKTEKKGPYLMCTINTKIKPLIIKIMGG